jgi:quercetin dioxygenase-like cupin family protein
MKRLMIGATPLLAAVAVLLIAATALATSPSGLTSGSIAQGTLEPVDSKVKTGPWKLRLKTKGLSDVSVSENRVAPGGHFGWHSHPGASIVVVKSGTSTFYHGDDPTCTPDVHPAGTAYIDPGGMVHIARNEGDVELVLIVTRIVRHGATPRIDEPNPGTCGF